MEERNNEKLQALLKRLGRVIHASVVDSDEVNACLAELHAGGWEAVMHLEAFLVCRGDDNPESGSTSLHLHVDSTERSVDYRLGAEDARWLATLGISPTRHRSRPQHPLPPLGQRYFGERGDNR